MISESLLKQFFLEIYQILRKSNSEVNEVWCEFSEIEFFKTYNDNLRELYLDCFNFISIRKGNYINYLVLNKILFIIESLKFLQYDIKKVSELLDYKGFEMLIEEILIRNNYKTITNFRFSDKSNLKSKTKQKRYEIDVIGINSKYILVIDAKQWKHKDSFNPLNKAANLQFQRIVALKRNPGVFSKLIRDLLGMNLNLKKILPFILIPAIVTIENNSIKINNNQIPIISIYQFNSFLQEINYNLQCFNTIKINRINVQKHL